MLKLVNAFVLICTGVSYGVGQSAVLQSREIKTRLDAYLTPYLEQKDFSGVALLGQGEYVLQHKAYGSADGKNANRLDTKFRVASLTKTFTSAAIVMLSEQGKLKLDDPLGKIFPDFPNGRNIKIEHLLLHQSGMGGLNETRHMRTCYSGAQLVEEIGKIKPYFPPGADSSYSNEGYSLLAAVIEKVSGGTYADFLQNNFFRPLKMNDSGSQCSGTTKDMATGHMAGGSVKSAEVIEVNDYAQIGAGSVYSTAPDLLKWLKAIDDDLLFDIDKWSYPYGWGKRNYDGKKLIEQSGIVEGFNAYIALYPVEKLYVVYLSNIQSGLFGRLARDLKAVAFGGEFTSPPRPSVTGAPVGKPDYAGQWKTPSISVPLNVIAKDGKVYFRFGEDPSIRPLTPLGGDKFYHRVEYADITFERSASGVVAKIKWQSGPGDPLVFERVPEQAAEPFKPSVVKYGATVAETENALGGKCKTLSTRRIETPFRVLRDLVKDKQMQIDCDGFQYFGKPRMEFVFADDKLEMVWILTEASDEATLLRAMTVASGEVTHRNDKFIASTKGRSALRTDKPEVLFYSEKLADKVLPWFGEISTFK